MSGRFRAPSPAAAAAPVALGAALFLAGPSHGAGVPTVDSTAIAEAARQHAAELQQMALEHQAELAELLNQLEELNRLYETAQAQLAMLQSAYDAISNVRNLTSIFDRSGARLSNLDFGTYIDLAQYAIGEEGSVPPRAAIVIERMKIASGLNDLERLYSSDKARDRRIAERGAGGLAVMATAEAAMNGFDEDDAHLDDLMDRVGQQPDLKAAVDYNTGVTVELARIMNKLLLVQSLNAHAAGTDAALAAAGQIAGRAYSDRRAGE